MRLKALRKAWAEPRICMTRKLPDLPPSGASVEGGAQKRSDARTSSPQDAWDEQENITPLTRDEARKLFGPKVDRPSRITPLRVVAAQIAVSLLVALVVSVFPGQSTHGVLSALLGGAACWVPGVLFALYLKGAGARSRIALIVGEAFKAGITLALFIVIGETYHEVRWLPMLVAYAVGLKVYWVALAL
jgi:ATP synthase protein I